MTTSRGSMRSLTSWKTVFRQYRIHKDQRRWQTTLDVSAVSKSAPLLDITPPPAPSVKTHRHIKAFPPRPSTWKRCKDPIAAVMASQMTLLDPTGARKRLFHRSNPESAKVGDILLVRQKNGEPFSGVCMNIRRRGVDTGILLRNQLTRVGVEMWYKIFSPNVSGIEVVQRKAKRARRAKLYYMRKPKHDMGSVENIVRVYSRQRAMLGTAGAKKDAQSYIRQKKKVQKKGKGKKN
ncbi:mitochondrial ribosomal protein-like protein [Tothia fuscella]|uniref:Mitochondrial ribosomal protein-like protein n=1 Tax=Tothia fuscella TaxID=1048955 RepID=A0A9P4P4M2_9PEZI|nr:mitochondrial ribosomal protein-like protein [Tothia fuscella]